MNKAGTQLFSYFQVSLAGSLLNFCSRFILAFFFSFGVSVIVANYLGMIVVFLLSHDRVFKAGRLEPMMLVRFAVVAHIGLLVVWMTAMLCQLMATHIAPWIFFGNAAADVWQHAFPAWLPADFRASLLPTAIDGLCHGTGILAGFAVNFLGHKYFSFRKGQSRERGVFPGGEGGNHFLRSPEAKRNPKENQKTNMKNPVEVGTCRPSNGY